VFTLVKSHTFVLLGRHDSIIKDLKVVKHLFVLYDIVKPKQDRGAIGACHYPRTQRWS